MVVVIIEGVGVVGLGVEGLGVQENYYTINNYLSYHGYHLHEVMKKKKNHPFFLVPTMKTLLALVPPWRTNRRWSDECW